MDIAALQIKMRDAFRVEAADLLAELDSSMLELESRPQDPDLLNRVFRAIHTIKGSGATAGFNEMAAFTHHVEELFDEARMGRLTITPEMIDLALKAKDLIGRLLEPDGAATLEPACAQVVEALAKFLPHKVKPSSNGQAKPGDGPSQRQRHKIFFKPHPQVFFSGTDPVNVVDELRALGEAAVTARVDGVPTLESLNPEQCYLAWEVNLLSALPLAKIKEVFLFVEDESEIRIESHLEPASSEAGEAGPLTAFLNIAAQSLEALSGFLPQLRDATEPDLRCCKNYLRILRTFQAAARHQGQEAPATLVEEQIQLLEEAVTSQAALSDEAKCDLAEGYQKLAALIQSVRENNQRGSKLAILPALPSGAASQPAASAAGGSKPPALRAAASIRVDQEKLDRLMQSAGELLVARNAFPILAKRLALEHGLSAMGKEVKDAGNHISHIAEDLQAAVMSIRMMPIRTVFQRFPRMVRDICRAQGKEAELLLEGEDTELDKTVIEQIADPLVHLVRNAADHGIESPEVRVEAGKPRAGKVTLKAYNKENNVVIEILDDGAGMDPARLKAKAVEKGLITPGAAEAMNDRAALELIFLPGLTTAEAVTDISGRGVGMDVVRSNIRQLQGTTTLESRLGSGSRITITLPASLMVSKGILVEANGEAYVFPIASVVQMVRLPRQQLHRHEQAHFATFRNEVYPLLRLADHFAIKAQSGEIAWPEEVAMAIIQTNQGRVGVVVDRFVSDVEVIVKPLGRDFANIAAFQGATIMGDGRVALVINPAGFV
jgi:two-component system chemotaxis sensor kinase CheA